MNYFISFSHGNVFGCIEIERTKEIRGFKDIEGISKLIEDEGNFKKGSVIIINWKKFS